MTVELNTERIYTELSWLRQEVQGLRSKLDALAPASRPSLHTEHPHIVRSEGVHGGRPVVHGTGVSDQAVIEQTRLGRSPAQIVEGCDRGAHPVPGLRRAQLLLRTPGRDRAGHCPQPRRAPPRTAKGFSGVKRYSPITFTNTRFRRPPSNSP